MRACLTIFAWFGCAIAVYCHVCGSRLESNLYFLLAVAQLLAIYQHLSNRRFLTAVFGSSFTAILIIAVLVEWTPEPNFDPNLTEMVYTPQVIGEAYNALLLASSLFHALALHFVPPSPWQWREADLAEAACAGKLLAVGLIISPLLMLMSISGSLVTNAAYASEAQRTGASEFQSSGVSLISIFTVVMTLVAAARLYGVRHPRFIQVVVFCGLLVFYFRMMRGDRGGALIFFATTGLLFLRESVRPTWQKMAILTGCIVGLFAVYETWGFVRANAHELGLWQSVCTGWDNEFFTTFIDADIIDPLEITLLPQSYWHLLHAVDLYNSGISLNGETIYALVPQSLPAFIAEAVGVDRPLNSAWRLGDYRLSGGGMFIVAEGYWNFGLAGAAGVAAWLAVCVIAFERWFEKRAPLLTSAYFGYMGTFGFSIYYGLQPHVRALQLAVAMALLLNLMLVSYRTVCTNTERAGLRSA